MSHEPRRTNEDYSRALLTLLETAREHGLDTADPSPGVTPGSSPEALLAFLRTLAEARAEDAATIRWLYNLIHDRGTKP